MYTPKIISDQTFATLIPMFINLYNISDFFLELLKKEQQQFFSELNQFFLELIKEE